MPLSAQIKLSSVIQDVFGASGRDMLAPWIVRQRSPHALADLARKKMRAKMTVLDEALTGHVTEHHAVLQVDTPHGPDLGGARPVRPPARPARSDPRQRPRTCVAAVAGQLRYVG